MLGRRQLMRRVLKLFEVLEEAHRAPGAVQCCVESEFDPRTGTKEATMPTVSDRDQ